MANATIATIAQLVYRFWAVQTTKKLYDDANWGNVIREIGKANGQTVTDGQCESIRKAVLGYYPNRGMDRMRATFANMDTCKACGELIVSLIGTKDSLPPAPVRSSSKDTVKSLLAQMAALQAQLADKNSAK